jgi:predicted O-methyltransferase YrrM
MQEQTTNVGKVRSVLTRHPIGLRATDFPARVLSGVNNRVRDFMRLNKSLAQLRSGAAKCGNLGEVFDEVQQSGEFRTEQKRAEVLSLLEKLAEEPPRFLCEIGSSRGGTLFLLARVCAPNATIISIDLGLSSVRRLIYQRMANKHQRIVCIRGDSRSAHTIRCVEKLLGKNRLDCLFIDGDHSLIGVMSDFVSYSRLVRKKGTIAFHDIVADHRSRFGTNSANWTGGVPKFWSWIKTEFDSREFVEDPEQDGYGLGVVHW